MLIMLIKDCGAVEKVVRGLPWEYNDRPGTAQAALHPQHSGGLTTFSTAPLSPIHPIHPSPRHGSVGALVPELPKEIFVSLRWIEAFPELGHLNLLVALTPHQRRVGSTAEVCNMIG